MVKAQVLAALEAAHGRYLSGQELADRLLAQALAESGADAPCK